MISIKNFAMHLVLIIFLIYDSIVSRDDFPQEFCFGIFWIAHNIVCTLFLIYVADQVVKEVGQRIF